MNGNGEMDKETTLHAAAGRAAEQGEYFHSMQRAIPGPASGATQRKTTTLKKAKTGGVFFSFFLFFHFLLLLRPADMVGQWRGNHGCFLVYVCLLFVAALGPAGCLALVGSVVGFVSSSF